MTETTKSEQKVKYKPVQKFESGPSTLTAGWFSYNGEEFEVTYRDVGEQIRRRILPKEFSIETIYFFEHNSNKAFREGIKYLLDASEVDLDLWILMSRLS